MRIAAKRNIFSPRINKNKRLFARPLFYYILAIILFICAVIVHPWDLQYKEFITTHQFLDIGPLDFFLGLVRDFGNGGITAILALIFAAYGYKKLAYRIAISLIVMGIIVNVLKPVVGRERPNGRNDVSFPSGDAATASAFFAPMAAESNFFIPGAIIIAPAVGFLRTYDNWHWLSDVVTGTGVGFLAVGFALYFCEKKNRLYKLICCQIKSRHYVIISLIVLLACFIPELIKGGGKYFSFTSFFIPPLYVWLAAIYTPFLFNRRSEKCKPILKPAEQLKQYFNQVVNNNSTHNNTLRTIFTPLAAILAIILIVPPWVFNMQSIALSCSGIGIGIIVLLTALHKIRKSNNYKRIKPTLISGALVLVICALLTLLPAYLRG